MQCPLCFQSALAYERTGRFPFIQNLRRIWFRGERLISSTSAPLENSCNKITGDSCRPVLQVGMLPEMKLVSPGHVIWSGGLVLAGARDGLLVLVKVLDFETIVYAHETCFSNIWLFVSS